MTKTEQIAKFLMKLRDGGTIVGSATCSEYEIAQAQACRRFLADDEGFGYVYRPAFANPYKVQEKQVERSCSGCQNHGSNAEKAPCKPCTDDNIGENWTRPYWAPVDGGSK